MGLINIGADKSSSDKKERTTKLTVEKQNKKKRKKEFTLNRETLFLFVA